MLEHRIARIPLVGRMLADSAEAWIGLADAMNLGALHELLIAPPKPVLQLLEPQRPAAAPVLDADRARAA
jgi:hypothetical protein